MSEKTKTTVQGWDALEAEKCIRLQGLQVKLEALKTERGELLIQLSDGSATANKEITAIEKQQKDIKLEIESIEALLTAIPKRRALAQADEIEATIHELQGLAKQMDDLKPEIDAAADAFVLTLRKFFDLQEGVREINPNAIVYQAHERAIFDTIGVSLRKHNLWKYIKVGDYIKPELMTGKKTYIERSVDGLVGKMRKRVESLRDGKDEDLTFCKRCYGPLVYSSPTSMLKICHDCGAVEGQS